MDKKSILKLEELGKTVMPIVGFWGPPDEAIWNGNVYPSLKTDEVFARIKESGINLFLQDNDPYDKKKDSVEKTLELCEKYNLFYYVSTAHALRNFRAYHNQDGASEIPTAERIAKEIQTYITHSACAGLFVVDEPSKQSLSDIGCFIENYKTALNILGIKDKGYYVNLLPVCSFIGAPTIECWEQYLERAVLDAKLEYLSYDFYVFQTPGISKDNVSAGLYSHMEAAKEISDKYGNIPYGVCVPTGGYWKEEADNVGTRRPEPEEIEWIVNTHLAFGCKMITYFTLCNPISFFKYLPHGATGILSPDGEKSTLFDAVKNANEQVAAVDEYLLKSINKHVLAIGDIPSKFEYLYGKHIKTKDSSYQELVFVEGDGVLIGCFDYEGCSAFYVVNTFKKEQKIKLVFNGLKVMKLVDALQGERIVEQSELELLLEKGKATLVIINE